MADARGERKFAVVLFADLTGYTELCRRLDPEDVAATVRPVMTELRRAVTATEGIVTSMAGDGFMAVFGVPHSLPDPAHRALAAVADMREHINTANATTRAFRIPDVHVGVAAGEVLVVPAEEPPGWSLIGAAVNLASRLCDAAGADEVLIDDAVRDLVGLRPGEIREATLDLPGISGNTRAWHLVAQLDRPVSARTSVIPFVDRVESLRDLDEAWAEVSRTARSRTILVAGSAGSGKSRLVSHWLEREPGRQSKTLWSGPPRESASLVELVQRVGGDQSTVAEMLIELPSGRVLSTTRFDPFPAVLARARQIVSAAADHPLVIVLDDLHRADSSLTGFAADVHDRPLDRPVLVLATWRDDEAPPPWQPELELSPLERDDTVALLHGALGGTTPPEITEVLLPRIAGHPLMAVQSVAYLVESGAVRLVDGTCHLERPQALDTLPTSLRLFVASRIDRLPASEKAALQELSTFGEEIDAGRLQTLSRAHVHRSIDGLIARGLLRPSEGGWRFSHGLLQQVAYASLPRSVRAELHHRHLQLLAADDLAQRAHHAQRWADCVSATEVTQRRNAAGAALTATADHAELLFSTAAGAALGALRDVDHVITDDGVWHPEAAARLRVLAARCHLELGRFEEALRAAQQAGELSAGGAAPEQYIAARLTEAHALSRLRRFQAARQLLDEVLAAAERSGDRATAGQALLILAETWRHSSFSQFVALAEEAHAELSAAGEAGAAAECACVIAYLRSFSISSSFMYWRELATRTAAISDPRIQLWLARADLEAFAVRGRHTEALFAAERATSLGEVLAAADGLADGLAGVVRSATNLGKLDDAAAAHRRLVSLAIQNENPRMRFVAAVAGMAAVQRSGRRTEFLAEHEVARANAATLGPAEMTDLELEAGRCARDAGQWQSAALEIRRAAQTDSEPAIRMGQLAARVLEATVHVHLPKPPTTAYLESLAQDCDEAGAEILASYARAAADRVRLLTGDDTARSTPHDEATLEELAFRTETAALDAERTGDAGAEWRAALAAWSRLGHTIFRARAAARSGDVVAAEETLRLIGAPDEARDWALSPTSR